jgi:hypothetical protein
LRAADIGISACAGGRAGACDEDQEQEVPLRPAAQHFREGQGMHPWNSQRHQRPVRSKLAITGSK